MKKEGIKMTIKLKRIILMLLLLIWMFVVFSFSNQDATTSTGTSNIIVLKVAEAFDIVEQDGIDQISFVVRKLAHFTLYAVGGIISFGLLSTYSTNLKKKFLISEIICMLYAISDEIHQSFVPGRSAEIKDVVIDSLGAFCGMFFVYKIIDSVINKRS